MQLFIDRPEAPSAIRTDIGAIFVSMELGRSTWLITSLSPGGSGKMSKHGMREPWRATGAFCGASAQGVCADRRIISDRRHSGSGSSGTRCSPSNRWRRQRRRGGCCATSKASVRHRACRVHPWLNSSRAGHVPPMLFSVMNSQLQ